MYITCFPFWKEEITGCLNLIPAVYAIIYNFMKYLPMWEIRTQTNIDYYMLLARRFYSFFPLCVITGERISSGKYQMIKGYKNIVLHVTLRPTITSPFSICVHTETERAESPHSAMTTTPGFRCVKYEKQSGN